MRNVGGIIEDWASLVRLLRGLALPDEREGWDGDWLWICLTVSDAIAEEIKCQ